MTKGFGHIFLLIILIAFSPAMASGLTINMDGILKKASGQRFPDPVLIKGLAFAALTGGALGNYRVYACREGIFEPIRFQIDEMTEKGDFVFPHGELSNKRLSNGLLDPRDVLLFMAHDAGDRISETFWPESTDKGMEIEIIDPVNQARSWVYLLYFEKDPPPLCPLPDYFNFDHDTEHLWSEYWQQQFAITNDGRHSNYHTNFSIFPKGGGNGENFSDRLKIRSIIKLFFGRITIIKNEENLESYALNAWIQGPIRVVRRIEHYVKGPFGMKLLRVISDVYYYETMSTVPIHLVFPFKIDRVVTSLTLRIGTDFSPAVKGSMFYNSNNPQGVRINGKMDETEAAFNPAPDRWRVMIGDWGAYMTRSVLTPEAEKYLQIVQGITDDEMLLDPPETYPGCIGWTWQLWRVGQLPGGQYTFYLEFYIPPHYKPGDEVPYLNYLDDPLTMKLADKIYLNQTKLFGTPGKEF